jgi:hypothetical protein
MEFRTNNFGNTGFKVKRTKFGIGSLLVTLLFGAIFSGAGVLIFKNLQIDESWTRTQGKVVDVSSRISDGSTTHTAIIGYTVDGMNYRVSDSTSSGSYPTIGNPSEVAFNPARPAQSKVVAGATAKLFVFVFGGIGLLVMLSAPIFFFRSIKRSSKIDDLTQTGQKVQGILSDIQTNSSGNSNSSYKIVVSAADISGTVQQYTSDSLSGIAGLALSDFRNNPVPIDVYIDPTNPENYFVDISDIPNLSADRIAELIRTAGRQTQPQSVMPNQPQSNNPLPPQVPPFK